MPTVTDETEGRIRTRLREVAGELAKAEETAGLRAAGMVYPPTFSKAQRWTIAAVVAEEIERLRGERRDAESRSAGYTNQETELLSKALVKAEDDIARLRAAVREAPAVTHTTIADERCGAVIGSNAAGNVCCILAAEHEGSHA